MAEQVETPTAAPARRTALRRLLVATAILGPALAILGLLAYGFTTEPKYIPTPFIGKPASPFTLTLFDGSVLRLEDFRGKVVFLNFWASWCPPCRAEARTLEAAWRNYRDQGVVFVGVNIQDEEESARAFLEEFGITYPNGIDRGARIAIEYGVWGLPETFFIDRDGHVTNKHVRALDLENVATKLEEAMQGVVSTTEGRGEYQSSR
ncbi:MAG: redoxin domain-containing protein [Candidatus Rokubacteria bacterium]|nr:redoxin domain-containing protein [Candidatus Rokubacteria bacterium]